MTCKRTQGSYVLPAVVPKGAPSLVLDKMPAERSTPRQRPELWRLRGDWVGRYSRLNRRVHPIETGHVSGCYWWRHRWPYETGRSGCNWERKLGIKAWNNCLLVKCVLSVVYEV